MSEQGKIINLFGAPCAGKSMMRGLLFGMLKAKGIDCEEVHEWIKGPMWEERFKITNFQNYVTAKQLRDMERVVGKVDLVITDSPTLLGYYYSKKFGTQYCESTRQSMVDEFKRLGGLNLFITRTGGGYNPKGRMQTETEAATVHDELFTLLTDLDIVVESFASDQIGAILARCLDYVGRDDLVTDSMRSFTTADLP